ncbi:MAG: hypothetical protein GY800_07740 [Planctomycetes bacterium]|nr:hypothetical protein [Planctomycetota bacterium]
MNIGLILGSLLGILVLLVVFNSLRLRRSKPTSRTTPQASKKRSLKCCDLNKSEVNVFGRR